MTLSDELTAIFSGSMVQFAPVISVPAAKLIVGQEFVVDLPQDLSTVWLPPNFVSQGSVVSNPANVVLGVRVNLASAPQMAWGLSGNLIAAFSGPVRRLFITLLSGVPQAVTFYAGRGIGVSYSGGMTAAGTPSSSPAVGGTSNYGV